MSGDKQAIRELLIFINQEVKKVSSEFGLPLYDREEELLIYKVEEFMLKQIELSKGE